MIWKDSEDLERLRYRLGNSSIGGSINRGFFRMSASIGMQFRGNGDFGVGTKKKCVVFGLGSKRYYDGY